MSHNTPAAGQSGANYGHLGSTSNLHSQGYSHGAEKSAAAGGGMSKGKIALIVGALAVVGIALGVGLGVGLSSNDDDKAGSSGAAGSGNGNGNGAGAGGRNTTADNMLVCPSGALTGTDGSSVTMENGTTFTYRNQFGGNWTAIPYDDSARAQDDVPILSQPWDFEGSRIRGVNLGGWLMLEPFIAPAMFEPYRNRTNPSVVDEWTLMQQLLIDDPSGKKGDEYMEAHYSTFITEEDFARIAGAGLSWIRLSVPFWLVEKYDNEPYATNEVLWKYFLKALNWSRKYGIRVNLDLHAVPGSANGWNHGGRLQYNKEGINFLNGPMGLANAQRAASYIRALTTFVSTPGYKNVVPVFGIVNEPYGATTGYDVQESFYTYMYHNIRAITGFGQGNGPVISLHDGFRGQQNWANFLPGADRVALDNHPYFVFEAQTRDPMSVNIMKPCNRWAGLYNTSSNARGINIGGEYSAAINDCSLWLNNIGLGNRYDGTYPTGVVNETLRIGSCDPWLDYRTWNDTFKEGLSELVKTSMDAMQNSFFWTWRIGPSAAYPFIPNAFWSYSLGLEQGWIDPNARQFNGACASASAKYNLPIATVVAFTAFPSAAATGGAGAGNPVSGQLAPWPPAAISNAGGTAVADLPAYTNTASYPSIIQHAIPCQPSGTSVNTQGLWDAPSPTATPSYSALATGYYTPVSGSSYPDQWRAQYTGSLANANKRGLAQPTQAPAMKAKRWQA